MNLRIAIQIFLSTMLVTLTSPFAHAREMKNLFGGVGLYRSMATYKAGSAESTFNGWGAGAVAGFGFDLGSVGTLLEAEYGRIDAMNTRQSTTYMEKSVNTYIAGRVGFAYHMIGVGGGLQQNSIDVDNVTTLGTSGRTTYKGIDYFGFARITIDSKDSFRTILEAKYTTGTFSGLEIAETALGLRFVFLPF